MKSLLVAAVMFVAACGGASIETTAPPSDTTSTQVPGLTTIPGETTSSGPDGSTTTSDRMAAPDFTLQLGDGGTYTLSEGAKPVYLVFWAEW